MDESYQTAQPGVYACGDVIGYPALASTSMEQGARAAHHMWGSAQTNVSCFIDVFTWLRKSSVMSHRHRFVIGISSSSSSWTRCSVLACDALVGLIFGTANFLDTVVPVYVTETWRKSLSDGWISLQLIFPFFFTIFLPLLFLEISP